MEEARKDETLAAAVALGWRVAELYSLVDDPGDRTQDTLLPAHSSLAPGDQLELQIRAAQGEAERAGVKSEGASLSPLVAVAHEEAGDHRLGMAVGGAPVVEPLRLLEAQHAEPRRGERMADQVDGRLAAVRTAKSQQLVLDVEYRPSLDDPNVRRAGGAA